MMAHRESNNPCLVYKPITTVGGLERYVAELAVTLDAPVYTPRQTVALPDTATDCRPQVYEFSEDSKLRPLLHRLPTGSVAGILEFEHFQVPDRFDTVITVSEPAKAVIHQPHQRRLHLLNMPPRWLFDEGPGRYDDAPMPVRWAAQLYQSLIRMHDITTTDRIEEFVVPSEIIESRLRTYYCRKPKQVIYPPVPVDQYRHESGEGFLLYVGRLAPSKRVVELVEALSDTDHQLKVAGTGPDKKAVRAVAGPNVDVLGYVTEQKKRSLLAKCDAVVFNSNREAFGIVPVEAFASGKPVVGIDEGFTTHQIQDGRNGVLFDRGPENLEAAVERMYKLEWDPETIRKTAEQYGTEPFREAWRQLCFDTEGG